MNNLEIDYGNPAIWGVWTNIHCGPYPREEDPMEIRTCRGQPGQPGHPRILGAATSLAISLNSEGFTVGR